MLSLKANGHTMFILRDSDTGKEVKIYFNGLSCSPHRNIQVVFDAPQEIKILRTKNLEKSGE